MPHEIIERYLEMLRHREMAPATLKAARSDLAHLTHWWESKYQRPFDPADLVERDLRAWKADRQKSYGAAPSTINRGLSTLRRFCAWATEQGLLIENPATELADVPGQTLSPRALPDEAIDGLLRAVRQDPNPLLRRRDGALLALLVYAGLRVQEACDIQLRDLDLEAGTLIVRSGKGKRPRRIPLHPDAHPLLQRYLKEVRCPAGWPALGSEAERQPLLVGIEVTRKGQPLQPGITPGLVRQRLHVLGQRAAAQLRTAARREPSLERAERLERLAQRLEAVSPHTLRHSLARRMLKRGAHLSEVQRVLGHSRLSTTGIYLTPSEDDLREAIGRTGV
jgi:integrase/recombinase XerC